MKHIFITSYSAYSATDNPSKSYTLLCNSISARTVHTHFPIITYGQLFGNTTKTITSL